MTRRNSAKLGRITSRQSMFHIGSIALVALLSCTAQVFATKGFSPLPEAPVKGMITMVEIGSDQCLPCRMMAPIISELEKEYGDRAAIVFIDAFKDGEQAQNFDFRMIPTQIFYDRSGNEIYRHEGFFDKAGIVAILEKAGVKQEKLTSGGLR